MSELIDIRQAEESRVLATLNCACISRRFFHRSRAWFAQRLNNNMVNGRPVSFTPDELMKLRSALKTIASEITKFSAKIPKLPTDMSIKVYIVTEPALIDFIIDNDIEGFKAYLDESKETEEFIMFDEPECFDTEAEALAFCGGIGYGTDEHATPERFPLRTSEEADLPFIEAIQNY